MRASASQHTLDLSLLTTATSWSSCLAWRTAVSSSLAFLPQAQSLFPIPSHHCHFLVITSCLEDSSILLTGLLASGPESLPYTMARGILVNPSPSTSLLCSQPSHGSHLTQIKSQTPQKGQEAPMTFPSSSTSLPLAHSALATWLSSKYQEGSQGLCTCEEPSLGHSSHTSLRGSLPHCI